MVLSHANVATIINEQYCCIFDMA